MGETRYDAVVIGAGVVGLTIAIGLAEEGARTLVLERSAVGAGASEGNAGLIVPSYSLPLATPSNLRAGLRSLFGREEGVSLALRPQTGLLGWSLLFGRACRARRVVSGARVLATLAAESLALHEQFAERHPDGGCFTRASWLHVYRSERGLREAVETAELLESLGVASERVDGSTAREREPLLTDSINGGVSFSGQASVEPESFLRALERVARENDVALRTGSAVRRLAVDGPSRIVVETDRDRVMAPTVVAAAGAWTAPLVRQVGIRLPMLPGKGFSRTAPIIGHRLRAPLLFGERHVVMTPFATRVRMTSGLRLGDWTGLFDAGERRNQERAADEYLREPLAGSGDWVEWTGLRPLPPDGLPIVGPTKRWPNVLLATGHAALGVTLSFGTAKMVVDFVNGRPDAVPAELLPRRFGI